jgi:hypothetical protein
LAFAFRSIAIPVDEMAPATTTASGYADGLAEQMAFHVGGYGRVETGVTQPLPRRTLRNGIKS